MGTPKLDMELFENNMVLTAFKTRRHEPTMSLGSVAFFQQFLNQIVQMALAKGMDMNTIFHVPINMSLDFGRALLYRDPALTELSSVQCTSSGMFDWGKIFGDDVQAIKTSWQTMAMDPQAEFILSTSDITQSYLGDLIGFMIFKLQFFQRGIYVGLAFLLLRQFGQWLSMSMGEILSFSDKCAWPDLHGLYNICSKPKNMDISSENVLVEHTKVKIDNKKKVYNYCCKVSKALNAASSKTATFVGDGWRGKGEPMELYFCYSPLLNLGGYLPFQVPHPTKVFAFVFTIQCDTLAIVTCDAWLTGLGLGLTIGFNCNATESWAWPWS
jgi:hypothetical protein